MDRSGAYMARYIAKNIVAAGLAEECTVSLAYAIGRAEPVAVDIDTHGTGVYSSAVLEQAVRAAFDLTPSGMIRTLKLDHPMFAQFCTTDTSRTQRLLGSRRTGQSCWRMSAARKRQVFRTVEIPGLLLLR